MTITKERLLKIQHWRETYGSDSNVMLPAEEAAELARIVLASLTAEPVFYIEVEGDDWTQAGRIPGSTFDFNNLPDGINQLYATPPAPVADADPVAFTDERNLHHIARGRETSLIWGKQNQEVGDIPLYRHAQPAPVVHQIMRELVSLLDEDQFARIENIALSAGVMPPQPAPAVPDEWTIQDAVKFCRETGRQDAGSAMEAWNACRTAMLQGSQPVSNRDELPYAQVKAVADLYALCWQSGEVVTYTPDPEKATIWINNYSGTCVQEYVKLERLQEALAGNSPVIPDDWVMVPKEPTQAMIKAWLSEVANFRGHAAGYRAALEAAPQLEVNRG
ncbi:TPA: hypothetical protein ACIWOL_002971 [Salmonella enterica subsp. enterica serovar Java]